MKSRISIQNASAVAGFRWGIFIVTLLIACIAWSDGAEQRPGREILDQTLHSFIKAQVPQKSIYMRVSNKHVLPDILLSELSNYYERSLQTVGGLTVREILLGGLSLRYLYERSRMPDRDSPKEFHWVENAFYAWGLAPTISSTDLNEFEKNPWAPRFRRLDQIPNLNSRLVNALARWTDRGLPPDGVSTVNGVIQLMEKAAARKKTPGDMVAYLGAATWTQGEAVIKTLLDPQPEHLDLAQSGLSKETLNLLENVDLNTQAQVRSLSYQQIFQLPGVTEASAKELLVFQGILLPHAQNLCEWHLSGRR